MPHTLKFRALRVAAQFRQLRRTWGDNKHIWQAVGRELVDIADREQAARATPEQHNSMVWIVATEEKVIGEVALFKRYLPDPRARRGRPPGHGRIAADAELFASIEVLVAAGISPTAAAKQVLGERGERFATKQQEKDRADRIVREFKRRGKK